MSLFIWVMRITTLPTKNASLTSIESKKYILKEAVGDIRYGGFFVPTMIAGCVHLYIWPIIVAMI